MQIVLVAVALASAVALIAYFGFPAYYELTTRLWPNVAESDALWTWIDWGYLLLTLSVAIGIASVGGAWLSQRIVVPLLEVARAIRAIAAGDLQARANPRLRGFGESARLVDDFNVMAERLERAEIELRFSNSAAAHELRTPLTILKGRLQGISDGVFAMTPDLNALLLAQVDGLTRIVDDLRTLGLFNAGALKLSLVHVDMAAVVRDVSALYADGLDRAGMALSLQLEPAVIWADPNRMRQVLVALVENAIRYAPGTPLLITTSHDGRHIVLSCRDHGPGLSEAAVQNAFEPFWRAEESRTRDQGGSGLGLAVVRAIVLAHNGRVNAANADTGGSCFTIVLPIKPGTAGVPDPS